MSTSIRPLTLAALESGLPVSDGTPSPNSSSSSLGSSFERSRSSSSSSLTDVETDYHQPVTYVRCSSRDLKPRLLKIMFDTHNDEGRLGLCVGHDSISFQQFDWTNTHNVYDISTTASHNFDSVYHTHSEESSTITAAGLRVVLATSHLQGNTYILERPSISFLPVSITVPLSPTINVPTLAEWTTLWNAWDIITTRMIPQSMLHQKPIDLRHKCLFYIGHIPTFLDMLLSKAIGGEASEPKYFWNIFERGIDPHVDDPDHCHNHSEVPEADEDWPDIETVLAFRDRVRARLVNLYNELETGKRQLTRNIARTLMMTLEHEGWHVETLLYMLLQKAGAGTIPPPGFAVPPWETLSNQWDQESLPQTPTIVLEQATVTLGQEDSEGVDFSSNDLAGHTFGWDNENPSRQVTVGSFKADWRPVTNGEFEKFWRANEALVGFPKSWVMDGSNISVRTMYGPIPMRFAQHWPVLTSYDDLCTYAQSKGGRLPTEPELRLFLDKYDVGHEGGANIGFRNWHPVPATTGLEENHGRGSNGGVWEWTTTPFDTHDGLVPTKLFTGYSTDFFDTKHQVVLGASYATIPRLGRRTVRNFYQHNYPYPWVGARVVYDL